MRTGYGGVVALTIVALGVAAGLSYVAVQHRDVSGMPDEPVASGENADSFAVRNAEHIRPHDSLYAAFARDDSLFWSAEPGESPRGFSLVTTVSGGTWMPTAEQAMRDRVFRLTQANRLEDAAAELERWVVGHPRDRAASLELARLHARLGRIDQAAERYDRLLREAGDASLRAEYAALLLANARYADAAREYSRLVARDSADVTVRLGLARAYAWDGRAREAERELRWLAARAPGDTTVAAMLRAARASIDPTADEARGWLAEDPSSAVYRLALARALVREGRAAEGAAHFDTLVMRDPSLALLGEAAGAYAAAGDSIGAERLLGRAVAMSPADTSLRRRWAEALAWTGDRQRAIAEYGRLLGQGERADLLLARGRLLAWSGRLDEAIADLARSAALAPSYEAYATLGDVHRWRGDARLARAAYASALALRPNDPAVLASLAAIRREQRAIAWTPVSTDVGWSAHAAYAEDNAGFLLLAAGVRRGVALGRETAVSLTTEQRRIAQRSATERERYVYGYSIAAEATRVVGAAARAAVRAGYANHGVGGDVVTAGATIQAATRNGVRASLSIDREPAYRTLMSLRTVAQWRGDEVLDDRLLVGRSATVAVGVPVGPAELSATAEEMRLSDGNRRRAVSAGARLPLGRGVSAIYTGGALGFSERAEVYWDPERYTSHSVGVEWARRAERGLGVAVRVLPGVGRSTEIVSLADGSSARLRSETVTQLSAGGELSYRRERWDIAASGGYGRGREGGYQALSGTLRLRVDW